MPSVDDRIVRMEFDNTEFQKKIDSTLTSLSNLDKAMKFDGAKEGANNLAGIGSKFSLEGMNNAIDGVSAKFLAMATVGITALANITNKAVDAAITITKSFAVAPITQGFSEYELKMGSIQTIMAGTGESLDKVNQKLDELNTYSDRTIYSFSDMTQNIGKFTNAGVKLDDAVSAIQGVANEAAVSGANADEAARAMYNFGQALGTGSVKLIDWKSIDMANMGTVEFKNQLLDTALAMGEVTKQGDHFVTKAGSAVTATQGWNDSLKDEWLTTNVLTKTLGDYADETTDIGKKAFHAAQDIKTFSQMVGTIKESIGSGWAQSFEIMFGNFEEGKHLWTSIGTAIGDFVQKTSDNRNAMLNMWKFWGGRDLLIKSLGEAFSSLGKILTTIKDAFHDVFPAKTAADLVDWTQAFARFVDKLTPSVTTLENVKRIFTGFFSILSIGWEILKDGVKFAVNLIKAIGGFGSGNFLASLAKVGDFFTGLQAMLVKGEGIKSFFDNLTTAALKVVAVIVEVRHKIVDFFESLGGSKKTTDESGKSVEEMGNKWQLFSDILDKLKNIWSTLGGGADQIQATLTKVSDTLGNFFTNLGSVLSGSLRSGDFGNLWDFLDATLLGGLVAVLYKISKGIKIDLTGGLIDKINNIFKQLGNTLKAFQLQIKAQALMKIAIAIAILTASILVLSLIDSAALAKGLGALSVSFGELLGAFALINKIDLKGGVGQFAGIAAGMILLSGALFIMAFAVKKLGEIDLGNLTKGIGAVGALLVILVPALNKIKDIKGDLIRVAISMGILGLALMFLSNAVKSFGEMNLPDLLKGLAGAAAGLFMLTVALDKMPKMKKLNALVLLAIAKGLGLLAQAVQVFASMPWSDMIKGLAGMALGLFVLAGALNAMPDNLGTVGIGLLVAVVGLRLLATVLESLASLSIVDIIKSLLTMEIALRIISSALEAMKNPAVLEGAAAILVVSFALTILKKVIEEFAKVGWAELAHGILGLVAVIGALALTAVLIEEALPAMIGLGIALLALGAGFALFGFGVKMLGEGFVMLSKSTKAGADAVLYALKTLAKAIPTIAAELAKGLLEFLKSFVENVPELINIVVKLLTVLIEAVRKIVPKLLAAVGEIIVGIFELLRTKFIPEAVKLVLSFIVALITGIKNNIKEVVTLLGQIIVNVLDGLAEQIPRIIESLANLFEKVIIGVSAVVGHLSATLLPDVGKAFIQGFLDGLESALGDIWPWIKEQFSKIIDIIKGIFGINSPSTVMMEIGIDIITGLLNGIVEAAGKIKDWFLGLAGAVLEWIGDVSRWLWDKGIGIIESLVNGIADGVKDVKDWFMNLGKTILGWIGDSSEWLLDVGKDILAGLLAGIDFYWKAVGGVKDWIVDLPNKLLDLIKNPFEFLRDVGEQIMRGLKQGLLDAWHLVTDWVSDRMEELKHLVTHPWEVLSPSRYMMWVGEMIMSGFALGLEHDKEVESTIKSFGEKMKDSLSSISDTIETDYKPVITPVIEMSALEKQIHDDVQYLGNTQYSDSAFALGQRYRDPYDPSMSQEQYASLLAGLVNQAKYASLSWEDKMNAMMQGTGGYGVTYQQNIYAPTQLSTSDIYKQTRNQITMAKEELSIP